MTATAFNSKLKKFLKDHDQNQAWLAKKLGVPATTMSSWMWGTSSPRKERRDEILARLDFLRGQPLHHEPLKHTPNVPPKPRKQKKVIKEDKLINPELERLIDNFLENQLNLNDTQCILNVFLYKSLKDINTKLDKIKSSRITNLAQWGAIFMLLAAITCLFLNK